MPHLGGEEPQAGHTPRQAVHDRRNEVGEIETEILWVTHFLLQVAPENGSVYVCVSVCVSECVCVCVCECVCV